MKPKKLSRKSIATLAANALATKVNNDIAEGIDNGETREELRAVISWWADLAAKEAGQRFNLQRRLKLIASITQLPL